MTLDKVDYAELTPGEFRERLKAAPIAYLPLGTLEWHGAHLPLGADGLQSAGFFRGLAREAGGIVLPMVFLGPDRHEVKKGRDFYGMDTYSFPDGSWDQLAGSAYWVDDDLFDQWLRAILAQLARAGFRVVVAHGHGPSTKHFRAHIPDYERDFGLRCLICWREDESDGLGIQTDHAAANETSLVLALHPDLVAMENLPEGEDAILLGIGGQDPRRHASAEKGREILDLQTARLAGILRRTLADLPNSR